MKTPTGSSRSATAVLRISGQELGGLDHARRVRRLPPGHRVEVGRQDLAPAWTRPAIRESCSTASGPTVRRAATGWSRRSARSSREAAATSSWSAGLNKPSLTCEVRIGPDGQPYFEKGGKPATRDCGRFNWWGRDPQWKDVLGFRGSARRREARRRMEPDRGHLRRRHHHQHRQRLRRQRRHQVQPHPRQAHLPVRRRRDPLPQDRDPAAGYGDGRAGDG